MLSIDAHIDIPWVMHKWGVFDLEAGSRLAQFSTRKAAEGKLDSAFFALYLGDKEQDNLGTAATKDAINKEIEVLSEQGSCFIVDNINDAEAARKVGLFPIFLGLEGGRILDEDLDFLAELRAKKVRYLTLTHNTTTSWCDSATGDVRHAGISQRGLKIVKKCEELGILVDVSHTSETAAFTVCMQATKPVIASHSGCKQLNNHLRNLSYNLMGAIVQTGGVIGIPYVSRFLANTSVWEHIDYVVQRWGIDHVGIGSDMDGAVLIPRVSSAADWNFWQQDLKSRGYNDEDLAKIAGGNFGRLLQ